MSKAGANSPTSGYVSEHNKLSISDLSFAYGKEKVLDEVSLQINRGEIVALIGPNGSGKTTLLKCANRLLRSRHGTIDIAGDDLRRLRQWQIAERVSYVPQAADIVYPMTVFESVMLGLRRSSWHYSEDDMATVANTLEQLGLDSMSNKLLTELSGGQRQKAAIARALVRETPFLLLDEPTNHLDMKHKRDTIQILRRHSREHNQGILIVLHEINLAVQLADRIALLESGQIVAEGQPDKVITHDNIHAAYAVEVNMTRHAGLPFVIGYRMDDEQ
ncbi:ABC transporter ATP-binding protein [Halorhodospira halochloris]|uniref:ABC transporter ATP-binding protein n=1 Tax=Halorhodospira halochloris TaxID=1052 RepID=UPI001EE81023|nr:ABC transporter ATP-binding protein [Halorhodospira halochloris]MCG5529878.1 ABC transporter ATP-binding protein [Halorhodospira halochloris]